MRHLVRAALSSAIALFLTHLASADDVGGTPPPQQEAPKLDANGDGVITDAERDAARAAWKDIVKSHLDANGDGVVSDAERKAGRAEIAKRRKAVLAKFDADGDGRLDASERQKMEQHLAPGEGALRQARNRPSSSERPGCFLRK